MFLDTEHCDAHQVILHAQHLSSSKINPSPTQVGLLNDDPFLCHTSSLTPEEYVDREFPTPWTSPTSPSHWLSLDFPEGKPPCILSPAFIMVALKTPWNLGRTPVDIHDELITLTEEFLDYVAQNPCKNILQGIAWCSKLVNNAMFHLNHNYKYCTFLRKLRKDLSSQSQALIYEDPPAILDSPLLAELTPRHSDL